MLVVCVCRERQAAAVCTAGSRIAGPGWAVCCPCEQHRTNTSAVFDEASITAGMSRKREIVWRGSYAAVCLV